ncbi:lipoate--protein ligase family protein [Candidatus Clavichlamydia salmonicola]|uniref:lipoate--protein ligase family protein n=1 Tax=Candidatus Clavichlamydia salmonicola TaxID=469812 RepID=UPI001890CDC9|nr:lipoate--protein ligase family protein [Candidatus Clavichlamydia salmonicola]
MSLPNCFHLHLSCSVKEQLIIEELLLHNSTDNWCIINSESPATIVMGITGIVDTLLFKEPLKKDHIPIIRRFSGGGTVLIEPDTVLVSFIQNTDGPMIFPETLMKFTKNLYAPIFPIGFDIRENDYIIGEKKIGGNAQYIRRHRWLHHTSFLWSFNQDNLNRYLKIPPQQPVYRKNRPHASFLTSLNIWFPNKDLFIQEIMKRIRELWTIRTIDPTSIHALFKKDARQHTVSEIIL